MNELIGAGLQLSLFTQIFGNSLHLKFKMDFDREILKAVVLSLQDHLRMMETKMRI
jgi:hypothetical protein